MRMSVWVKAAALDLITSSARACDIIHCVCIMT